MGNKSYPEKLTEAKRILADFKAPIDNDTITHQLTPTDDGRGLEFMEAQEWLKVKVCFECGKKRHRIHDCNEVHKNDKYAIHKKKIAQFSSFL